MVFEPNTLLSNELIDRPKQTDEYLLKVARQDAQLNNDVASIKLKDRDSATSEGPQLSAAVRYLSI